MNPDVVNGLFEFLGCFFIGLSVRKIYRDKKVAGVSWLHVAFWSLWGAWNLFYYPHLDQWWSFWGGLGVTCINTFYVAQLIYYGEVEKLRQTIRGLLRPWQIRFIRDPKFRIGSKKEATDVPCPRDS